MHVISVVLICVATTLPTSCEESTRKHRHRHGREDGSVGNTGTRGDDRGELYPYVVTATSSMEGTNNGTGTNMRHGNTGVVTHKTRPPVDSSNPFAHMFRYTGPVRRERPAFPHGDGCMYMNVYRDVHELFSAGDNCNLCVCVSYDVITCTILECSYDSGCIFIGQIYDVYEHFPMGVGCKECVCTGLGLLTCTLNAKC